MSLVPSNLGYAVARKLVTANYTALASDQYIAVGATATVTLPKATSTVDGQVMIIANTTPGTFTVAVDPHSGDTIGGIQGNLSLATTASMVWLVSDGVSNWECVRPGTP